MTVIVEYQKQKLSLHLFKRLVTCSYLVRPLRTVESQRTPWSSLAGVTDPSEASPDSGEQGAGQSAAPPAQARCQNLHQLQLKVSCRAVRVTLATEESLTQGFRGFHRGWKEPRVNKKME